MEVKENCEISSTNRKRKPKATEEENNKTSMLSSNLLMDNLTQDVLERVLSSCFRLTSVSKHWKSAVDSASFKLACSAVPSRDLWFLMLPDPHLGRASVVFDSANNSWKTLTNLADHRRDAMPVMASGGLVCLRNALGDFAISKPLSGSLTRIPPLNPASRSLLRHAITITKTSNKLALVLGDLGIWVIKGFEFERLMNF